MAADRFARLEMAGVTLVVASAPHAPLAGTLSPAERRVAQLVAVGLSNTEIARARGTSARTVANQIGSIIAKLGVRGRRDVARALLGAPRRA